MFHIADGKINSIEPRDWLIAISLLKGIGRKTLLNLLPYIKKVPISCQTFLTSQTMFLQPHIRIILEQATLSYVSGIKKDLDNRKIGCLTYLDPNYPPLLKQIPDFPFVLYYQGDIKLIEQPSISIVGTRSPTGYGRKVSYQFAENLSHAGFVVVSGLAKGIDAEAHRGALLSGHGTIAVLGNGVDVNYPREHDLLYRKIKEKGLIISEYPPGTSPHKTHFPERNRIISGLCLGVVVIEAAKRSGSQITVKFALEQNRDVFAVPGSIYSPLSKGPNDLIKEGAKLVCSTEEIVEDYPWVKFNQDKEKVAINKPIEVKQGKVLDIIEIKQASVDDISQATGFSVEDIIQQLVILEMEGKVKRLLGNEYVAIKAGKEFDK